MKSEHDDYVLAHRLSVNAEQDVYNWEQIQQKFYSEEDWVSKFIGGDFVEGDLVGDWVEGIPQYLQARLVDWQCGTLRWSPKFRQVVKSGFCS